jgi:hypothetical protein
MEFANQGFDRPAMEAMAQLLKPLLLRASRERVLISLSGFPQGLSGMIEVENAHRTIGKALVEQSPTSACPIRDPSDLSGGGDALTVCLYLQAGFERIDIARTAPKRR